VVLLPERLKLGRVLTARTVSDKDVAPEPPGMGSRRVLKDDPAFAWRVVGSRIHVHKLLVSRKHMKSLYFSKEIQIMWDSSGSEPFFY
jgi:hypothetical protein